MFYTKTKKLIGFLVFSLISHTVYAKTELKTETEKYSYAIGVRIASNLKNQNIKLDADSLSQAIIDVLNGNPLKVTPEEQKQALNALLEKDKLQKQEKAKLALDNGKKFLAENKKAKGVITLDNGMQYKILQKAKGKKPKINNTITAHYEGKLLNGTVFDSSYKRGSPETFPVDQVIKGWQKIIPMMPVGSIWEVVIPPDLAYGGHGTGKDIGPNETLIFKIELISIKSE